MERVMVRISIIGKLNNSLPWSGFLLADKFVKTGNAAGKRAYETLDRTFYDAILVDNEDV